MLPYSRKLSKLVRSIPGEKYLGPFRFLPIFFVAGALLEFCMINWHVGETNFYKTYKKRQVENIVNDKIREMESAQLMENQV